MGVRGRGGGLRRWWLGVGGGVGWRSGGLGGREVSLSFSPRQLLLSKSVLVIRQAVSCCPLLVPRVLESPLSGISPGDLFVVFPSFDCFFPLSFFYFPEFCL